MKNTAFAEQSTNIDDRKSDIIRKKKKKHFLP